MRTNIATRKVISVDGKVLDEAVVDGLKASLRGDILRPGDASYDGARKIWNAMIDKSPSLIVRCTGVADIINSVNFARRNNLVVAVHGGGHNAAGNALCDGGMVIDLSRMKGIRVDPRARTVRAEAGVTWGELDRETQAFGLATTGGVVSTTGIAGLTLGGGEGWLVRKYGLACDNLLSVDIVTADARFLTASPTENVDLFWGLRGGGGNFGIVTSFEYRLHQVGPTLLAGVLLHPMPIAKKVLQFYREFTSTVPDEFNSYVGLVTLPDGSPAVGLFVGYFGPPEEGERVLRPIREFRPPIADQVRPMTYIEVQKLIDPFYPPGLQNYWKSNFLKDLSDEVIDTMLAHFATVPSPLSIVVIEQHGGAISRVGRDNTAYGERDAQYNFLITSAWRDPGESERNIRWSRQLWEAMQPFSTGTVYVNYLGQEGDEGAERVKAAYGAKYERLVALKNKYDPTNFFRLNQNIKPIVSTAGSGQEKSQPLVKEA